MARRAAPRSETHGVCAWRAGVPSSPDDDAPRRRAMTMLWLGSWILALSTVAAQPDSCAGGICGAAERFTAAARPGMAERDRYLAFVRSCGEREVVALTKALVSIPTVSRDPPEKKA